MKAAKTPYSQASGKIIQGGFDGRSVFNVGGEGNCVMTVRTVEIVQGKEVDGVETGCESIDDRRRIGSHFGTFDTYTVGVVVCRR